MISISGYFIKEQLYNGSRTLVYRAVREDDQKPVIIKLLKNPYPTLNELLKFRNQYTIVKNLDIPGIVHPYSFDSYRNSYALVMEDFGGISLREYMHTTDISIVDVLSIGLQISDILHNLHQELIIHKDIKPSNILINPENKQVKLIDFCLASLLPKENQEIKNPNSLEGTLAYISPEQTGRMNRGIDYRSDFYSLGVTLYELLAEELPFNSDDVMELIHSHIAKQPLPIRKIPRTLSDIVIKLMAKNAEDRYQSALGLKYDLENCLQQFKATGKIDNFQIAQGDKNNRFIISEKLYGRETQVKELLAAFNRVAGINTDSESELMLVAGFSGIGKTALIKEVHKPIVKQRGYFIKGKFDQFHRNIPLSAFVQAFQDLIAQLLGESDAQLSTWKTKILQALGDNAQVIIEVIPSLEKIIGQQLPATELSGTAAQNRFYLLFQNFIQIFTTKEHPLVIFLDDLQWADSASLKMMQLLMSESSKKYLLMIGAYRDNEVNAAHPLMLNIADIRKTAAVINTIYLSNLNTESVNQLVADSLNCSVDIAKKITKFVYQKTQGNPFFTTQFLKGLHQDNLIKFDAAQMSWVCDISEITTLAITSDVVEFMVNQIQKLPESTQEILKSAACVGNQFDLGTLAIIKETSKIDVANALWEALQSGLILPQSELYKFYLDDQKENTEDNISNPGYRFLHDRVQQAAYSLIPEDDKKITHYKLGKLLFDNFSSEEREDRIFDIVNQLNFGISLIATQAEKEQLARLNLMAGRKAKAAIAYNAAFKYFAVGRDLLATEGWDWTYELTLALYEESAKTAYLNTDFYAVEQFSAVVIKNVNLAFINLVRYVFKASRFGIQALHLLQLPNKRYTLLDRINIYITQIESNIAQAKLLEAIKIALEVLKLIDTNIDLPEEPSPSDFQKALAETQLNLADKPIADLLHLPKMENPHQLAAMRILASIGPPAYLAFPALLPLIAMKMVNLSIKFGNTSSSAYGYAMYAFLLCGVVNDIDSGSQFGQLALNLVDKFNAKDTKSKVLLLSGHFIKPWKESLHTSLCILKEGYQVGLETGDLGYASYSASFYCFDSILAGKELVNLSTEISAYSDVIAKLKQEHVLSLLYISQKMLLILLNSEDFPSKLIGEAYDEAKMVPIHEQNHNRTNLAFFYLAKLQLYYLFGNYEQARDNALKTKQYLDGMVAMPHVVLFYFYDSLVKLALFKDTRDIEQNQIKEQLEANQAKMRYWSENAPMNCLHKFYLIEAEKCRMLGQKLEAIDLYDKAISKAQENNFIHEQALAHELVAKLYLDWGKDKFAAIHIQEAYYCYTRWGAKAKTVNLEKQYPDLLQSILQQHNHILLEKSLNDESIQTIIDSNNNSENLDYHSILKSTQSLSSEIQLEQLIDQLIKLIMENSGADKSALLLLKDDGLILEAVATLTEGFKLIHLPYQTSQEIPISIINYVKNSLEKVILNDSTTQNYFLSDEYFNQQRPLSILCIPILKQGKLIGLLYLENNLTIGAFTHNHIEILNILVTQAAISLENAQLYQKVASYSHTLEQKVEERTLELIHKATQLESTLQELKHTQSQLIQAEKMSSLGQLVAGIAHEINNPISFIYGNITPANEYLESLIELIRLYEKLYPQPLPEIASKIIDLDLEFIIEDLPKLLNSMKIGAERIREIILSLRNFSHLDESKIKLVDINAGLDSTLLILQHKLVSNHHYPEIEIVKEYNYDIPEVICYASELNQVFMNILNNAIDAVQEKQENKPRITIFTSQLDDKNILISIADNGIGISQSILNKIFDPFFTTKAVGSGTGLGLSTSYSIVVEKHRGKLDCVSTPGEGTQFIIQLPINH